MKARNKKTGEIIEVEMYNEINDNGFAYKVPAGKDRWLLFREDELDFNDLTDWQAFRREAAKDILAGMLSAPARISIGGKRLGTLPDFTNAAVKLADELIKQLKMGERMKER